MLYKPSSPPTIYSISSFLNILDFSVVGDWTPNLDNSLSSKFVSVFTLDLVCVSPIFWWVGGSTILSINWFISFLTCSFFSYSCNSCLMKSLIDLEDNAQLPKLPLPPPLLSFSFLTSLFSISTILVVSLFSNSFLFSSVSFLPVLSS